MGASSSKQQMPPKYSSISSVLHEPRASIFQRPKCANIEAYSVPQWKWATSQCRTWVYNTLVEKYEWTHEKALQAAEKYEGSGVDMYSKDATAWQWVVGNKIVGMSIRNYIFGVRGGKGAVPVNDTIWHWDKEEKDAKDEDEDAKREKTSK